MDEPPAESTGDVKLPSSPPPQPASLVKPGVGMPKALFGLVLVATVAAAAGVGGIEGWNVVAIAMVLVFGLCVVGLVVGRSQRDLLVFKREHKRWPTTDELDDWNQEMQGRRAKAKAVAWAARTSKAAHRGYAQRVALAERALLSARRQHADAMGSARNGLAGAERAHADAKAQALASLEAWRSPGLGSRIGSFKGLELYHHGLAVKGTPLPLLNAQAAVGGNRLTLHTSAKQEVVKLSKQDVSAALQFASQVMAAAAAELTFQQQRPMAIPAGENHLAQVSTDISAIEAAREAVAAAEANPTLLNAIRDAEKSLAAVRADTREVDATRAELSAQQEREVERLTSAPPPTWLPRVSNAVMAIAGIALVSLLVGGASATIVNVSTTHTASERATTTPTANEETSSVPISNPTVATSPTASALPSPRTNVVTSADALASAISSWGLGCNDFKADTQPPFAATQGRCHAGSDELVLAQYSTTEQRDQHVERLRGLLAGLDADRYLVIGDDWLINVGTNKDLTVKLATAFGATIVTIPKGVSSQTDNAAAGLQAAKKACSYYSQGVAPVIAQAVGQKDGALIIRVQFGEPPNGGPVDANAPWFLMNSAAVTAASYDSKYSALTNRVDTLNKAINAISPSRMSASLADVAAAGQAVQQYCSGLG